MTTRRRCARRRKLITLAMFILNLLAVYITFYTILVTPKRFFQCIYAPIAYIHRDHQDEILTLPDFSTGNSTKLLVNGNEVLPEILNILNTASQSIQWQVMLFQPDEAGREIADALVAAARRGVKVQLAFDINQTINGSISAPYPEMKKQSFNRSMLIILKNLRGAGVIVLDSGPGIDYSLNGVSQAAYSIQAGISKSGCISANHYDHRKILIVDGNTAILGGMNVGNEYLYHLGPDIAQDMLVEASERLHNNLPEAWAKWQDVAMLVKGPIVKSIVSEFNWRWEVLGGQTLPVHEIARVDGAMDAQFAVQRPGYGEIGSYYLNLINQAHKEIYIANPYVSYDNVLNAIMDAKKRGVRVVFIFPNKHNDVDISRRIFRSRVKQLVASGIEVYYNDLRMAHSKVMVVDGRWTSIGSFNLNYRSFRHDLEDAVIIADSAFAEDVIERVFVPYLVLGTKVGEPETVWWPIVEWLLQPFS